MCTTAAKRINSSWFLIKTRDPVEWMRWDDEIKLFNTKVDKYKKFIIQNPNPYEDGYYGGINEKGTAFIATFVPVAENQISYIRRPYMRLILDASGAKEAIKIIKSFNPKIGGNMFVADKNECYGIEGAPNEYYIEKISSPLVKTNHFIHLTKYKNLQSSNPWYVKWTNNRLKRAQELITKVKNVKDLQNLLRDRKNHETKTAICATEKEYKCCTYSAFIFDTNDRTVYYCQGNPTEKSFKKYPFS